MAGVYIQPNMVRPVPTSRILPDMLREAMDKAVAKVAAYFGGLARMDDLMENVSISHPEWDTIETFQADVRPSPASLAGSALM